MTAQAPNAPKQERPLTIEDSQKRWATYIEILKIDIGLAGALLGAFALVFSDPTKIPEDWAKWILAGVSVAAVLSLLFCLAAIIWINRLVIDLASAWERDAPAEDYTSLSRQAGTVSFITAVGFGCLLLAGMCIVGFIFFRAYNPLSVPRPVTNELSKIRQEQATASREMQSALEKSLGGLGDKLDRLVAIQQSGADFQRQGRTDLSTRLSQINSALQQKISDLETRQEVLERQLREARPVPPPRQPSAPGRR